MENLVIIIQLFVAVIALSELWITLVSLSLHQQILTMVFGYVRFLK